MLIQTLLIIVVLTSRCFLKIFPLEMLSVHDLKPLANLKCNCSDSSGRHMQMEGKAEYPFFGLCYL